jgi:hypothetical protein
MPEMILCACGCGKPIPSRDKRGIPRRWAKGHSSFHKDWKTRLSKNAQCACGCGAFFAPYDHHGRRRTFISGHNARGRTVPIEKRFWNKVFKTLGCWIWCGTRSRLGYGLISFDGKKQQLAHRVSWFLRHGEWPRSETLDHTCGNRSCVNPSHLEECSKGENSRRGVIASFPVHICGRPFDGTYQTKTGTRRYCKTCRREKDRKRYRSHLISK